MVSAAHRVQREVCLLVSSLDFRVKVALLLGFLDYVHICGSVVKTEVLMF